jgi:ATP-dependent Clp protease ATP-binding subunit ClpA
MSRTPVPFAPDTLESIRRAFRVASERRHDLVSLEHMLHALIEDPQARDILARCRVDLAALKLDLEEVLDRAFTPVPGKQAVKPNRRSVSIASSSARWCTPPRRARNRWRAARCSCSCCRKRRATRRTSCASRASIG